VTTRTGRAWFDEENGIVRFEVRSDVEQTREDAKYNFRAVKEVSAGARYPLLIDLSRAKNVSKEARDSYGGADHRMYAKALAIVGTSPISKMIANIWFAVYGDKDVPTKAFGSVRDAIAWLKGFAG
jgi:hypothetical protein